jgi:predicted double-glycine peptidase
MTRRRAAIWILTCALAVPAAAAEHLKVPFFRQEKNGCGAASVAMVVHYWRAVVPQPDSTSPSPGTIYDLLYRPERKGILLADMRRYLEELGFRAFTLRAEWTDLQQNLAKARPLIVGLKKKPKGRIHFAVVIAADADHVWLNDPTQRSVGRVRQSEFARQWELADRWLLLATPAGS